MDVTLSWQWICGLNYSVDVHLDRQHPLTNTCLVDVVTAIPHILAIVLQSFTLLIIWFLDLWDVRQSSAYHQCFPCHSGQWLTVILLIITQLGALAEGVLTDATDRYTPTQPHLYVPAACGIVAAIVSLVYSHNMEAWNVPAMVWLLLVYWLFAVVGQTIQLMSLLYNGLADVGVIRFDFCVVQLVAFTILVVVTLNIIRLKILCKNFQGNEYRQTPNAMVKEDMFFMEKYSNFLSDISYWWLNNLMWIGFKRPLVYQDLGSTPYEHSTGEIHRNFKKAYMTEKERSHRKNEPLALWRVLVRVYGLGMAFALFIKLIADLLVFVGPLCLGGIIAYSGNISSADPHENAEEITSHFVSVTEFLQNGLVLLAISVLASVIHGFFYNAFYFWAYIQSFRIRSEFQTMIYEKSLNMYTSAFTDGNKMGEISNYIASDMSNMGTIFRLGVAGFVIPIKVTIVIVLLYGQVGIPALISVSAIVVFGLLQIGMSVILGHFEERILTYSDERLKVTNEVLQGIKLLKLLGLEQHFENIIQTIRKKEMNVIKKSLLLLSFLGTCFMAVPLIMPVLIFSTYSSITGDVFSSSTAFTTISLISLLTTPLQILPQSVRSLVIGYISTKRLQRFFDNIEKESVSRSDGCDGVSTNASGLIEMSQLFDENYDDDKMPLSNGMMTTSLSSYGALRDRDTPKIRNHLVAVKVENGCFSWDHSSKPILRNINLEIPAGKLTIVIGKVGSGKSSLLSAVLGEMITNIGSININSKMNSVAYTNQTAWLLNDSLKENILFGYKYKQQIYQQVIEACALQPDIDILPAGDETEIGERGINLSGGQKQRVSVARALYSQKDIILMDDPLSALDVHVGSHLFEEGIMGMLLKGKQTVVLVTHQLQYMKYADKIVVMKDGRIQEEGTLEEIALSQPILYSQYQTAVQSATDSEGDNLKSSKVKEECDALKRQMINQQLIITSNGTGVNRTGNLTEEEDKEEGSVSFRIYLYFLQFIPMPLVMATVLFTIAATAMQTGSTFLLSDWSAANDQNNVMDTGYYIGIYTCLSVFAVLLGAIQFTCIALSVITGATRIFLKLLRNVLSMSFRFFDITPVGRTLNRLSGDTQVIDRRLLTAYCYATIALMDIVAVMCVNTIVTPYFIVFFLPMAVIFYFIQNIYLKTSRDLRRFESVSRSPVYAYFSETLTGLSTIRAYGKQQHFIANMHKRIEDNNITYLYLAACRCWLGVRLEIIASMIVLISGLATFLQVATTGLNASHVGLAISYALRMTHLLSSLVMFSSLLEMQMNSVERVKHYISLEPEEDGGSAPPNDWPSEGEIQFIGVSARYSKGLDPVLTDVNLHIHPGEKVGICGRTGSGKSSLALTLFRAIDTFKGHILIDGIDISTVSLNTLRQRLSIIPQDPVLFKGSIRMNLDPLKKLSDAELWNALDIAQLKSVVTQLEGGLEFEVSEGGENFSQGQRQLFCLARAFLRKSRILVMDEATASIDFKTDQILQDVVATVFADRTILTIAHRISTILESDTIMVLSKGRLIEQDTIDNLLADGNSVFSSLVNSTN